MDLRQEPTLRRAWIWLAGLPWQTAEQMDAAAAMPESKRHCHQAAQVPHPPGAGARCSLVTPAVTAEVEILALLSAYGYRPRSEREAYAASAPTARYDRYRLACRDMLRCEIRECLD